VSIRRVRQIDVDGCGVACLAMVTGQSYEDMLYRVARRKVRQGKTNFRMGHGRSSTCCAAWGIALSGDPSGAGDPSTPTRLFPSFGANADFIGSFSSKIEAGPTFWIRGPPGRADGTISVACEPEGSTSPFADDVAQKQFVRGRERRVSLRMDMTRLFRGVLPFFFLAACATSGRVGELPKLTSPTAGGKVVVARVSSLIGAPNTYTVALDGKDLFHIRSGEHTEFLVETGEHSIAVKCFGGWSPTMKEDSRKFAANTATTNYFRISPNMSCAEIVAVSMEEADRLLSTSTFIDLSKATP
jgi:hypothetical protein